jgi:hypothetical protein
MVKAAGEREVGDAGHVGASNMFAPRRADRPAARDRES